MLNGFHELSLKSLLERLRFRAFKLRDESFGGEGLQSHVRNVGENEISEIAYDDPNILPPER